MKKLYLLKCIAIIFVMHFSFAEKAEANWQKPEKSSIAESKEKVSQRNSENSKTDSLPAGVTNDWLNSLTDENGKRIKTEDPEGDAIQQRNFNGQTAGDNYGVNVSSAGDLNGDGFDDIIIGAPDNDAGGTDAGKVYIYYGGTIINNIVDVVIIGEAAGDGLGVAVSGAGDANGDGYSDVIVGAGGYNSNTGKANIYFGGPVMNNIPDVTFTGENINDGFGYAVSTADDVNGDGYSDVIIGAQSYNSSAGKTYIYFGGAEMNNVEDVIMNAETANDFFGISVSRAGDVNGDGYSDVIAGAYSYGSNTGRAYIFFGGTAMDGIAEVILNGETAGDYFGRSVSAAGDVNGDGFSDVITGAYGYDSFRGRAYLYYGGAAMNEIADVILTGEVANNLFGFSVSGAGDVNGDGYSDVITGASEFNSNTGRAYIYYGGAAMNSIVDLTFNGEASGNYFGNTVSGSGDINGDGYSDVIVGAFGYNSNTGRVYSYSNTLTGDDVPDLKINGEAINNYFGYSVSEAGDVNGDGYSDIIIGAAFAGSTGRAYIFYGGTSMDNIADVTMAGESASSFFGNSCSTAGDVNGDGYSDVIVGAYQYSSATGRTYIFFGGASMNNAADVILLGTASSSFGYSVSVAGDINGDGYSDVIVGASGFNSSTGRAYLYYGGSAMNNTADIIIGGEASGNNFGTSVSEAGDVNGDGYSDFIIGAYGFSSNTGKVYLFFGGVPSYTSANLSMTGEVANNLFGFSVSGAGDVNGDGYSDVITGACGFNSNTGRAYIYYGGNAMNNIADVVLNGESIGNYFGFSVSSTGDVNSDGYSDLIVGADRYNSNTGKAYIFFGGALMNNTPDISMNGEFANDNFGISVSAAGDLNGDGLSDIVVGAYGNSSFKGRSYIYLSSSPGIKPGLISVKDVPFDQGGKVNLKWSRSGYDVNGVNRITSYSVSRSYPPVGGNFAWSTVAEVTAETYTFYSFTDITPYDSSSGNSGTFFYRIKAKTSSAQEFWYSNILSGRSIDNIAPLMVSPFTATAVSGNVRLNWRRNYAPDLLNYILYRSTSPVIDPNTEPEFATTSDSTYLDTSPLSGVYYYFIVAQDIHNNKSTVAVALNPNLINLNMTMFIEGFYNSGTNLMVSDTVNIYLRNAVSPFAFVDSAKSVVSSAGIVSAVFANAPTGTYYIMIKHRNSIVTWSKAGGESLVKGISSNYNLSSSVSQAFGNNMISVDLSPVRFAIYSGDVNQDGIIDGSDISNVENDASTALPGYVPTDVTGDDFVDASDVSIVENNAAISVSVITP